MNNMRCCSATIKQGTPFDQAHFGKGLYAFKMDSKNALSWYERMYGLFFDIHWTAIYVKAFRCSQTLYVRTSQLAAFLNESVDDIAQQDASALTAKFYAAKCARKKALLTVRNSDNESINATNVILILQNIFSHLDLSSLSASSRVSRRWYIATKTKPSVWKTIMCRSLVHRHYYLSDPLITGVELHSLADQILKRYRKDYPWKRLRFSCRLILVRGQSPVILSKFLQIDTLDENIKNYIRRNPSTKWYVQSDFQTNDNSWFLIRLHAPLPYFGVPLDQNSL